MPEARRRARGALVVCQAARGDLARLREEERRMSGRATVDLKWIEGRTERWIRFGRVVQETLHSRSESTVGFDPGTVFAFVRWASNGYGTVESKIDILRAVPPGERCSTVPHVTPGGEMLLRLSGPAKR